MNLTVVTPNKIVLDEEVDELIVDTYSGQVGILPNHMKMVTSIKPGEMILKANGRERYYAITGGFLEVHGKGVRVLADFAVQSEEIQVEKAMEAKKRAEKILQQSKEGISERDFAMAQSDLRRAVSELHVANRRRRERSAVPGSR